MSDYPGATSRDSLFQTSDQADDGSQQHAHHLYGHYNAEQNAHVSDVSFQASHVSNHDPSMSYSHYNAQQQHVALDRATGFEFSHSVPLGWDDLFKLAEPQWEPQGELAQEQKSQEDATNGFSIPQPVTATDPAIQTPRQTQSAAPMLPIKAKNPQDTAQPPQSTRQEPVIQAGMKRKIDPESSPGVSQSVSNATENPLKRQNISQQSPDASYTPPVVSAPAGTPPPTTRIAALSKTRETASQSASNDNTHTGRPREQNRGTRLQGRVVDVSQQRKVVESPGAQAKLPAGKVFPIQIGSELFRLSGASISSDAPSYFSHFFSQQLHENGGRAGDVRTLYIDRDPETFRDIALHLQGYHVTPKNGEHFVKLFADAQFYSLPRLNDRLFKTDIFVEIGGVPFQIPRDLFSAPGDSPNYFSLGFAQFFSTPAQAFPGLDRSALLRPPSISPPSVPNRSGETFGELIRLLQGYDIEIRSDDHRSQLLRDARYFHLKGLEQKLIPCQTSYNLERRESEILIRLEDIRQSGISFVPDEATSSPGSSPVSSTRSSNGHVCYARPYTDDHEKNNVLILETSSSESTMLNLPASAATWPFIYFQASFHNATAARIKSLVTVITSQMGLPATKTPGLVHSQSDDDIVVCVRIDENSVLEIDGVPAKLSFNKDKSCTVLRRVNVLQGQNEWLWTPEHNIPDRKWTVNRAHWRIRVEPIVDEAERQELRVVLYAVKIEAITQQRIRNMHRRFLGSA